VFLAGGEALFGRRGDESGNGKRHLSDVKARPAEGERGEECAPTPRMEVGGEKTGDLWAALEEGGFWGKPGGGEKTGRELVLQRKGCICLTP